MKNSVCAIGYQFKSMSIRPRGMTLNFLMVTFIVLLSILLFSVSSEASDLEDQYLNLPNYLQLKCAEYKMKQLIEKLRSSNSHPKKLAKMELAHQWLLKASKNYDEFRDTNSYYTGKKDPEESPLGMMKHLWLAEEGMKQSMYNWGISPHSPDLTMEREKALTETIKEAVAAISRAVEQAEAARGWVRHTDGMFFSIETPPEFKSYKDPSQRLNLQAVSPRSQTEKVLLVSVERQNKNIERWEYQDSVIAGVQEKFQDAIVIDRNMRFPGISGRWFSYEYTWEGKKIKGLIYHYIGSWIWEIRYLALADKFDLEECEGIIRSLDRK